MRILKSILFVLAGVVSAAPASYAGFGIGLQPTTVEMVVGPGDRHRQVITVGNPHLEQPIKLTVSVADWSLDERGQLILEPPGSREKSASSWVRFSPAVINLPPNQAERLLVDIDVPAKLDGPGDYRTAVVLTTLLPDPSAREGVSGVWARYQLTTLFYAAVNPVKAQPALTAAQPAASEEGRPAVNLTFVNPGSVHARIRGEARLLDRENQTAARQNVNVVVLDSGRRELRLAFDEGALLPPGEYRLDLDIANVFNPRRSTGELKVPIESALPRIEVPAE